jgi:hypothetical protein
MAGAVIPLAGQHGITLCTLAAAQNALQIIPKTSPLFAPALAVFQDHAASLLKVQDASDGRWHQVCNTSRRAAVARGGLGRRHPWRLCAAVNQPHSCHYTYPLPYRTAYRAPYLTRAPQVLDHPETYLETSSTAMNLFAMATGERARAHGRGREVEWAGARAARLRLEL